MTALAQESSSNKPDGSGEMPGRNLIHPSDGLPGEGSLCFRLEGRTAVDDLRSTIVVFGLLDRVSALSCSCPHLEWPQFDATRLQLRAFTDSKKFEAILVILCTMAMMSFTEKLSLPCAGGVPWGNVDKQTELGFDRI